MPHREIGGPRADKRAAGGAVAGAALAQDGAVAVLGVDGRMRGDERVDLALKRQGCERKRRGVVPGREDERREPLDRLLPGGSDGDAELRHLALDGVEPDAVVRRLLEEAVARAQRPLERG